MITTLDLLRHGECEGGHCYRGSIDVALTSQGRARMQQCIHAVTQASSMPWQVIMTSPLIRCAEIARDIAQQYQLPLQVEAALQEIYFGDWEGELVEDIWRTQSSAVEQWCADPVAYPPPNGEAADAFSDRVVACILALVRQYRGQHLLCVSHGGVIRALLAHCLSMTLANMNRFDVPYACFTRVQIIESQESDDIFYRLIAHNMTSDL
jgi:alpha-ribazole phosphatase